MKVIDAHVEKVVFHLPEDFDSQEQFLEWVARKCYKSEEKITPESADDFVRRLRKSGHTAMFEHCFVTASFVADRGMSHEGVRHRHTAFAQESTRYCNYSKGKFDSEVSVIKQPDIEDMCLSPATTVNASEALSVWLEAMESAEAYYLRLKKLGVPNGGARSVLPIATKTELVMTASLREWMSIMELRADNERAHKIIRGVMLEVQRRLIERVPAVFDKPSVSKINS